MKHLILRDTTRRAVSDISGMLLARFGIVATFDDVHAMAKAIDREMVAAIRLGRAMTPEEFEAEDNRTPGIVEMG